MEVTAVTFIALSIINLASPNLFPMSEHKDTFVKKDFGGHCGTDRGCVCVGNKHTVHVRCEGVVDIVSNDNTYYRNRSQDVIYNFHVHMLCTSQNLTVDPFESFSLLEMNTARDIKIAFSITKCPLPQDSYSSVFHSAVIPSANRPHVIELNINRRNLKSFEINESHMAGLSQLQLLTIKCPAIKTLPRKLFRGISDKIKYIIIDYTALVTIPEDLFGNLTELTKLSLRNSKLSHVEKGAFLGLVSLEELELEHNSLTNLDDYIFHSNSQLSYVSISFNKLGTIPKAIRQLNRLKILDVSFNEIEVIGRDDLANQTSMDRVTFEGNHIRALDGGLFSRMPQVTSVNLANNMIGTSTKNRLSGYDSGGSIIQDIGISISSMNTNLHLNSSLNNSVPSLPEDLFSNNPKLRFVRLNNNALNTLPEKLFFNKTKLWHINLSSNKLKQIPPRVFQDCKALKVLDLSQNNLEELANVAISSLEKLKVFRMSNNFITVLHKDTFPASTEFKHLDLSGNLIRVLPNDIFLPLNRSDKLEFLNLGHNLMTLLPKLPLPNVTILNLANNSLTKISDKTFLGMGSLLGLNLSHNLLKDIECRPIFTKEQKLEWLDLSHNKLGYLDPNWFPKAKDSDPYSLKVFNFSGNHLTQFEYHNMPTGGDIRLRIEHLDMSKNNMETFRYKPIDGTVSHKSTKLKHLDLSNNRLNFKSSFWRFDHVRRVWGPLSTFESFPALEVLLLSRNEIDTIPLELRHNLPNLRQLDLSYNQIKVLWGQDLLFSTGPAVRIAEMLNTPSGSHLNVQRMADDEYPDLLVDLRHNLIESMELLDSKMQPVPNTCDKDKLYSRATLLLGDNPFLCGCQVFNLLRYKDKELRPVSELERSSGLRLVLPAKVDIQGLQCWRPLQVRGMNVSEIELWTFHLMPIFGMCLLAS